VAENPRTAHVEENGASPYAVTIRVSGHEIRGDEPVEGGGANTGPAPYDTLLAALGECTAMTVRWYAMQKKWPLEKVEVNLTHRKDTVAGRDGKVDIFTKHIILQGNALTAEQRAKLVDVAGKCPVQRTLENAPIIQTD